MQQGNYTSINWGSTNNFAGYVYNDDIYTLTGDHIGVNLAKYQEVEAALLKCKNRLIELGEIKVPKTPEEIIKEQSELLEQQKQAITVLMEKIDGLNKRNLEPITEGHSEPSETEPSESVDNGGSKVNKNKGRRNKHIQDLGDSSDSDK